MNRRVGNERKPSKIIHAAENVSSVRITNVGGCVAQSFSMVTRIWERTIKFGSSDIYQSEKNMYIRFMFPNIYNWKRFHAETVPKSGCSMNSSLMPITPHRNHSLYTVKCSLHLKSLCRRLCGGFVSVWVCLSIWYARSFLLLFGNVLCIRCWMDVDSFAVRGENI